MKKKLKRVFTAFLCVLLLFALFSTNAFAEQTATVTGDGVRVRAGVGTNYEVLATLNSNTTVTVLDTSNSSWYKIRTPGGIEGYMSSEYLQLNSSDRKSVV